MSGRQARGVAGGWRARFASHLSIFFTLPTSHEERSLLNKVAPWNILFMLTTRPVSHVEISLLKVSYDEQ